MEQDIKIRFGLQRLEEQEFEIASTLGPVDAGKLEVRYLIETEIIRSKEKVKVTTGVKYSAGEKPLCELVLSAVYGLEPFLEIVVIDEENKTVSFKKEIVPTLLNITFGTLRGVLFEKTKGTPLAEFPLPLIPMPELVKMNRFRVEKV